MTGVIIIFNVYSDFTRFRDICAHYGINCVFSNNTLILPWIRVIDDDASIFLISAHYEELQETYVHWL